MNVPPLRLTRMERRWVVLGFVALVTLLIIIGVMLPDDAWARVGGGQRFSGGGGSRSRGGGFSGGGGGGGGEIDILILLIHLAIEVPAIGIPLLLLFIGFIVVRTWWSWRSHAREVHRTHHASGKDDGHKTTQHRRARAVPGLKELRELDEGFSLPVLYDFVNLVQTRAHAAIGNKKWDPLTPFLSENARNQLLKSHPDVKEVNELVIGGTKLTKVISRRNYVLVQIEIQTTRMETYARDIRHRYVEQRWTFRRAADAQSLAPEDMLRLACPSCGNPVDTTPMGACTTCDTPITQGQLQWQAIEVKGLLRRKSDPPDIGFFAGGEELSVSFPTVLAPDLSASMRRFGTIHSDFDREAFDRRVEHIYHQLQQAWSEARWEKARPFVTDAQYKSLQFWLDSYTRHGLRNELRDVKLLETRVVKVEIDAWFESITVRIWGSMKDTTVDKNGEVVGGNAKVDRIFSEYWTFLRSAGSGAEIGDPKQCPSCGAPLDKVGETGICGYCETRITSGKFDWVLSRIDQCEVYGG